MTPEYREQTEKDISSYLNRQGIKEKIKYIQAEHTFKDLGLIINVWNVKTTKESLWVVEGEEVPMNVYTQDANYFSADTVYSFHLGITQRLKAKYNSNFKHIVDELPLDIDGIKSISRRLNIAATGINDIKGPEDIQSIGLTCRESLIELGKLLSVELESIISEKGIKAADFKSIATEAISFYAKGKSNSTLRKYTRDLVDSAWNYSSELVHSPNKNYPDAKICLLFTCSVVSILQNLYLKYLGFDSEPKCPECGSMVYEFYEDEEGTTLLKCSSCDSISVIEKEED